MLHNLKEMTNFDIEFRSHGGTDLVTDETCNKMVDLADQGFHFVVGNHPTPKDGLPYGATEAVKVSQVNSKSHGKCIRTIWAVKGTPVRITLTNNFHNTSINLYPHQTPLGMVLSPSQVKRAKKALCGMADCSCSGALGTRGEQPDPDPRDPNLILFREERPDGSFEVWFGDWR